MSNPTDPQNQAAPPANSAAAAKPTTAGPTKITLKKGELLFAEGDNSRAMYLLKNGMIRIFKKKGHESAIEIDTVHTGQILGELAFLDGNPRSASGEALTPCELVEISGSTFTAVLANMPEWLKILLKTIVGRLRTASTRIRQLETASTAISYDAGKSSAHYVYLNESDLLKVCTAVLMAGTRYGKPDPKGGVDLKVNIMNRLAHHIMQVPLAKLTSALDVLSQAGVVRTEDSGTNVDFFLQEPEILDDFITWLNDEHLLESSKRHSLSPRAFMIMGLVIKHLAKFSPDPKTGEAKVNVAEIKKIEQEASGGKEPFRSDEFAEIAVKGFASTPQMLSANEVNTTIKVVAFQKNYRLQQIMMAVRALNESKTRSGNKAA